MAVVGATERAPNDVRSLVDAGEGHDLGEATSGDASTPKRARGSMGTGGWVVAGAVLDTVAVRWGGGLAVRWHPDTGRARVERPHDPAE